MRFSPVTNGSSIWPVRCKYPQAITYSTARVTTAGSNVAASRAVLVPM